MTPSSPARVLLIGRAPAGWSPLDEAPSSDVELQGLLPPLALARALAAAGVAPVVTAALTPGLGGIWTDLAPLAAAPGDPPAPHQPPAIEIVRIGYPLPGPGAVLAPEQDPFAVPAPPASLYARHWERIAFGRRITHVVSLPGTGEAVIARGLGTQEVRWIACVHGGAASGEAHLKATLRGLPRDPGFVLALPGETGLAPAAAATPPAPLPALRGFVDKLLGAISASG